MSVSRSPGHRQQQADAVRVVGDDQLADRVGSEGNARGRVRESGGADAREDALHPLVELLRGKGALAKPGVAHDLGGGVGPAVLLFVGQLVAEDLGVVPEDAAHEGAGRGLNITRRNPGPPNLPVRTDIGHVISAGAAAGFR